VQKDWKKLVAYSSVSHLGFVMLGLFALNTQAVQGAMLGMINHGISTGALFLLVGVIYERRHTRLISEYGGLTKVMPLYATVFMIVALSSIGLPPLNGFVGEFLILVGAFQTNAWWGILAATAWCSARSTCCGCSSASSSARSPTRRTRGSKISRRARCWYSSRFS
jgi:NADH-quinone oxidoreductase subunit M